MTLEEIEARWKAATPGPWEAHSPHLVAHNDPWAIISFETNEDYLATLHAPTDIAYLLDRVRELASDNRSLHERLKDEHESHNATTVHVLDELVRYKRAHVWLVENTSAHICAHQIPSGCNSCIDRNCDARVCIEPHEPDCEWVKAKELKL